MSIYEHLWTFSWEYHEHEMRITFIIIYPQIISITYDILNINDNNYNMSLYLLNDNRKYNIFY